MQHIRSKSTRTYSRALHPASPLKYICHGADPTPVQGQALDQNVSGRLSVCAAWHRFSQTLRIHPCDELGTDIHENCYPSTNFLSVVLPPILSSPRHQICLSGLVEQVHPARIASQSEPRSLLACCLLVMCHVILLDIGQG